MPENDSKNARTEVQPQLFNLEKHLHAIKTDAKLITLDLSRQKIWSEGAQVKEEQTLSESKSNDPHENVVTALTVLPNGQLAGGYSNGKIKIWDVVSGKCVHTFKAHKSVRVLSFVQFSRQLLSVGYGESKWWNLETMKCDKFFDGYAYETPEALERLIHNGRLKSDKDGFRILSERHDIPKKGDKRGYGGLMIINRSSPYNYRFYNVSTVTADGHFATGTDWGEKCGLIHIFDMKSEPSLKTIQSFQTIDAHKSSITSLINYFGLLISSSADGTIKIWDLTKWFQKCVNTINVHKGFVYKEKTIDEMLRDSYSGPVFDGAVHALAILLDGRLACGVSTGIKIWDLGIRGLQFKDIEPLLVALPNSSVKQLILQNTLLSDANIPALIPLLLKTTLLEIDIRNTKISPRGLQMLCQGLKQHRSLKQIHHEAISIDAKTDIVKPTLNATATAFQALRGNDTTEAKAPLSIATPALQKNGLQKLKLTPELLTQIANSQWLESEVDLSGNPLDEKLMTDLCQALAKNKVIKNLKLQNCSAITIPMVQILVANQTLISLDLAHNQIGDDIAKVLATSKTLLSLDLTHNLIGDEGAKALADNKKLLSIDLFYNKIGDEGAKALAVNKILTSLDIGANQINDEGVKGFAANTTLTKLDVSANNISDDLRQSIIFRIQQNKPNTNLSQISAKQTLLNADAKTSLDNGLLDPEDVNLATKTNLKQPAITNEEKNLSFKNKGRLEQIDPKLYQEIQEKIKSYKDSDYTEKLKKDALIKILDIINKHHTWSFKRCISYVRAIYDVQDKTLWNKIIEVRNVFSDIFSNTTTKALIERISKMDRLERTDPKLYQDIHDRIKMYENKLLQLKSLSKPEWSHVDHLERLSRVLKEIVENIDKYTTKSFTECIDLRKEYYTKYEGYSWDAFKLKGTLLHAGDPISASGYSILDLLKRIAALDKNLVTQPQNLQSLKENKAVTITSTAIVARPSQPIPSAPPLETRSTTSSNIFLSTGNTSVVDTNDQNPPITPKTTVTFNSTAFETAETKLSAAHVVLFKQFCQQIQIGGGIVTQQEFQPLQKEFKEITDCYDQVKQKLENADKRLQEVNQILDRDPIAIQEQKEIEQHEKLKIYQQRLQTELSRFITVYCLATTGLLQLTDNKKGVILNVLGELPVAGTFLKILTKGLQKANEKYRCYQMNRLTELFLNLDDIPRVCRQFARKLTLAKKTEIMQLVTPERSGITGALQGFYADVKEFLYRQWHDLKTIDTTGVDETVVTKQGYLDGAILIEKILSGSDVPKIDPKKDLVPQLLAVMGVSVKNEISIASQNTTVSPVPTTLTENTENSNSQTVLPVRSLSPKFTDAVASADDVKAVRRDLEEMKKQLEDAGLTPVEVGDMKQIPAVRTPNSPSNIHAVRLNMEMHWMLGATMQKTDQHSDQLLDMQSRIAAQQAEIERLKRKGDSCTIS